MSDLYKKLKKWIEQGRSQTWIANELTIAKSTCSQLLKVYGLQRPRKSGSGRPKKGEK